MKELEFEITKKDCINYNKSIYKIKRFRKKLAVYIYLPPVCLLLSIIGGFFYPTLFATFLTCFVVSTTIFCISYFLGGRQIYNMLKGMDLSRKITVDENGITNINATSNSTYFWKNVFDMYNFKDNIIIFIGEVQGIIIPKRVFSSELEATKFYAQLLEYYNNAKKS